MIDTANRKKIKLRIIAIAVLVIIILVLMWFSCYPQLVERYYSEGIYPVICHILHPVFNLLPFSIGDVLYIFVIVYLIFAFLRLIKFCFKKEFKRALYFFSGLIIGLQSSVLLFYIFWGMNYFRPPAGERLNLRDITYTTAAIIAVTSILIDSANATRTRVTPADLAQNNGSIYKTAVQAINKLSGHSVNFRTYYPDIKPSLLTPLLNYIGTSGYYDPFTGEAQMNYQLPVFTRPVVACHELSHQMGYASEDEANFAGFLAGIGSKDRLLQYSAYNLAVEEFMLTLYLRDSLANKKIKPLISVAVRNDYKAERAYWRSYQSKLNSISSIFYDHFLKVNNQPQGLDNYNRMVLLVMALYREKVKGID